MSNECPFCAQPNVAHAIVCQSCARDIAVPESLIAERDELIRTRDKVRDELSRAKAELETYRRRRRRLAMVRG